MGIDLSMSGIAGDFPDCRIAAVVAEDLTVSPERPEGLDHLIAEREKAARQRWAGSELSQIPGIAAWRSAYKAFGIKQTRYRSSVERIVKNVLAERELARVNSFVDLYNAVSLSHMLPLGADDLNRILPPLAFRYARADDTFLDMSDTDEDGRPQPEAPKDGEVVYADTRHVLCRRWNWRQDARTLITPSTRGAIVTLQSNGWGDVEAAAADLIDLIGRFCGGRCRMAVMQRSRPAVSL